MKINLTLINKYCKLQNRWHQIFPFFQGLLQLNNSKSISKRLATWNKNRTGTLTSKNQPDILSPDNNVIRNQLSITLLSFPLLINTSTRRMLAEIVPNFINLTGCTSIDMSWDSMGISKKQSLKAILKTLEIAKWKFYFISRITQYRSTKRNMKILVFPKVNS